MVRRVQVVTGKKSVRTPREGVIVQAVEGALEQLESRQLLSVAANLSAPSTSLSAHQRHVAHVKHVNHMNHVAAVERSTIKTAVKTVVKTPVKSTSKGT